MTSPDGRKDKSPYFWPMLAAGAITVIALYEADKANVQNARSLSGFGHPDVQASEHWVKSMEVALLSLIVFAGFTFLHLRRK